MALLNKLKSILGIGGSRDAEDRTDTSVTVERESTSRDTSSSSEDDHNEVASDDSDPDDADPDQAVATETDASASTGSMTETDEPETEVATEPGEAAGPPTDSLDDEPVNRDVDDVIDEAEDAAEAAGTVEQEPNAEDTESTEPDNPEPSTAGVDLTAIKGIGPAYSERLEAAGIGSVDELAAADAETLADQIDVSAKIVSDWIDRAAAQ